MKRSALTLITVVIASALIGGMIHFTSRGRIAQAQTTTIDFVTVSPAPLVTPFTGNTGDLVMWVGQPPGTSNAGTCAIGSSFPVQTVVAVDPGSVRATRLTGVIRTDSTAALPNGTRVGSLQLLIACTIFQGGAPVTYNKFRGTVQ